MMRLWSKEDFVAILKTSIATKLLANQEISQYINNWREENKAALLHANGITVDTNLESARQMLQLVAAFSRKDQIRLKELIEQHVPVGVRLDYLLPLFMEINDGGEDVFVTSVKIMLKGNEEQDVTLEQNTMKHKVGSAIEENYTNSELRSLEAYVKNSFDIRELLKNAPNKAIVQPTPEAVAYIIHNAKEYRDSNYNPTIVFIPGALMINDLPVPQMLEKAIEQGADVNSVGFFGVPGIVWSIILGDVDSVQKFLDLQARLDIQDEMGNKNVIAWARTTQKVSINADYQKRLSIIIKKLKETFKVSYLSKKSQNNENYFGKSPFGYFKEKPFSNNNSNSLSSGHVQQNEPTFTDIFNKHRVI